MQEATGGGVSPGLHAAEGEGRLGRPPVASCVGEPAVPKASAARAQAEGRRLSKDHADDPAKDSGCWLRQLAGHPKVERLSDILAIEVG